MKLNHIYIYKSIACGVLLAMTEPHVTWTIIR